MGRDVAFRRSSLFFSIALSSFCYLYCARIIRKRYRTRRQLPCGIFRFDFYAFVVLHLRHHLLHRSCCSLGVEIISRSHCYIPYAGERQRTLKSNEASLKYFLLGAFSTGLIMLMGVAFVLRICRNIQYIRESISRKDQAPS